MKSLNRMLWLGCVVLTIMFSSTAYAVPVTPLTPQSFGAQCDGTTDDTTALVNWANAVVRFRELAVFGDCVFKAPITFPIVDNVKLTGDGTLLYAGSGTTSNLITIGNTINVTGPVGDGCSIRNWFVENIAIRSTTVMTAGDGLRVNDICASHFININAGRVLNGDGTLYNAIHFNGGNTVHFTGGGASGQNTAMIVNGDTPLQFSDFWLECPTLLGSSIGLQIGGNVGGFNGVCGDVLLNHVNISIDQNIVAVANSQVFFGANLSIDITNGGINRDINITDAGSSNSFLFLTGTWVASAQGDCISFSAGATWRAVVSGGTIYNCGGAGVYVPSSSVSMTLTGTFLDYIHNWALNNPSGSVGRCGIVFGSHNTPGNIFGTVTSSC